MNKHILEMRKANVKIAAYNRVLENLDYTLDMVDENIQHQEKYFNDDKYLESLRLEKNIYQQIMQGISERLDNEIKTAEDLYKKELEEK